MELGQRITEVIRIGGIDIDSTLRYVYQMVDCTGCKWAPTVIGSGCNCPYALRYEKGKCLKRRDKTATKNRRRCV